MCPHIPWLHGILRSEPKQTSCRHWTVFLLISLIPWGVARLARPRMEIISACSCVLTYRSALGSVLCIPWSGEAALWKWSCERCCETALAAEQADELLLQQGRTWGLSRACVLRSYGRAFKSIIICLLQLCDFLFPFGHAFSDMLPLPSSILIQKAKNTAEFSAVELAVSWEKISLGWWQRKICIYWGSLYRSKYQHKQASSQILRQGDPLQWGK